MSEVDVKVVCLDAGPFRAAVMPAIENAAPMALEKAREKDPDAKLAYAVALAPHLHNAREAIAAITFKTYHEVRSPNEVWNKAKPHAVFVIGDVSKNIVRVVAQHNDANERRPETRVIYDLKAIQSEDFGMNLESALKSAIEDIINQSS